MVWSLATLLTVAPPVTLLEEQFDTGLGTWRTQGGAEFSHDPTGGRRGGGARLRIAPGGALNWPQLQWEHRPVQRGDQFQAVAWVRTQGLTAGSGAYACLEFLGAQGERVGIEHSAIHLNLGAQQWDRLSIHARTPVGAVALRCSLILNSVGTAWFDDVQVVQTASGAVWADRGDAERQVTVHPDQITQPNFAGVGFHVFDHVFPATDDELQTVIFKRWRELRPSFARLNHTWNWTPEQMDAMAPWFDTFRATATELYLATWGPREVAAGAPRREYAEAVVDTLEYLIRRRGASNLKWFCLTNELSLGEWGALYHDLPKFKDYHQELFAALQRRQLPVGLLASDASPVGRWDSVEWATQQMNDITAIYGGHEYFNNWHPRDEQFYGWFAERLQWAADLARTKGKGFVLGEFGPKQDGRTVNGVKLDTSVWWDTPDEPLVALQLADTVIACLNAGVYAAGYWTFMDFPDGYSRSYLNKWGLFKRTADGGFATRATYYGYGLLAKYCAGPAAAVRVETDDPWLRAGALRRPDGAWTIVLLNRAARALPVAIKLPGVATAQPFRRFVYDPAAVPQHPFGDLQPPSGTVPLTAGVLRDRIGANQLVVYTTAYEATPPPAVTGLVATRGDGGTRVTWQASPAPDLVYYRVFAGGQQIGSTIATHFVDPASRGDYHIVAVDQSQNVSP
ncbi:MAG: hypothetical protein IT204_03995 [Fimbriimonadaceae bacterium]|nr:hypothetical protein [Fimbriimonadaceae bacterium]